LDLVAILLPTITGPSAVQCITIDQHRFLAGLAVRFEHIDRIYREGDFAGFVGSLHGHCRIHTKFSEIVGFS